MHGFKDDLVLPWRSVDRPFEGVLATLQRRLEEAEDDETRQKWEAYQNFRTCPDCHGSRLRPESRAATVAGRTIVDVMAMPIREALVFFEGVPKFPGMDDILKEIVRRLRFLIDVGLDYLTLDRASATLSGGEMQRIRLATQIGSGLTGVLYVLDEPTIGLHPRDNERLVATLKGLRDRGNTVVVVEHDEEMMRSSDYIVDLGPGAGREGGKVMYQGPFGGLLKCGSLTADYLSGRKKVVASSAARGETGDKGYLTLSGCTEHNLKNITVKIPVGSFTVVTGVSGSGKSTLVDETLKRALMRHFYRSKAVPGKYRKLTGVENFDKVIEIDQSPIGRTPRSNPATYVGFFSDIRELFAQTEAAKARGYTAGRFSFNVKGGRCEVCGGDGLRKLEMSFLPDVYVTCEQCGGRRFNAETLEVTYGGRNIADVLDMTVAEACEFFAKVPSLARKLKTLEDVGLGYIALGQSATTLSGGEAQRIKLATELSRRSTGRTLYLLDEPTTGLHFDDVAKLMKLLLRLRDQGNTIVVIEHNTDVMKCADWLIDLGPGGGDAGGNLVCQGPVETVRRCKESVTGRFL
jgi:excinuclease ABC subunit A